MSRAFVKEPEPGAPGDPPAERPVSEHVNYVTPDGLAQLRDELDRLGRRRIELLEILEVGAGGSLPPDREQVLREELAYVDRDIRYFDRRLESAVPVDPADQPLHEVAFGATVTVAASGSRVADEPGASVSLDSRPVQVWTIVGEDEADPDAGKVSYVSPLAVALLGAKVGQMVTWRRPAGALRLKVEHVSYRRSTAG